MILQHAPGFSFSSGTGKECRGSRVASYSETLETGAVNNGQMKSISAMPQYINTSHEELRVEDYELLKESSFPSQNQGIAFQQSSSPFVPHTCRVPSSQSSTGGAFSSSPANSVLGTSSGFRTSSLGFTFAAPSGRPSMSPFTVSTSPSFGTLLHSSGGFIFSSTSNIPVSTTSGFIFGSSPASGSSSIFGAQASSGSQSSSSTKFRGSRVASYSATTEVEKAPNNNNVEYVVKFQSIAAMPSYNDKSHEELRLEDYGLGDKGERVLRGIPFHTPPSSFPFPPSSNQSSAPPSQPFKSTFSELERGNSVTSSNTISTIPLPTISSIANYLPPSTAFSRHAFTSSWSPPSLIPCTEPMHTSFEFPKPFPFTKPPVPFSPSMHSTPVTSSDSLPSVVSPSQPQQTAEKVGSFPICGLNKSSQGLQGKTVAKYQGSRVTPYSATMERECETYSIEYIVNIQSISAVPSYNNKSHEELRLEDYRVGDKGTTLCGNPFSKLFLERSDTQNIFPFPPSSNQSSVRSPFQPFKSTFSKLERGKSVIPSNTISTAPTNSPFVNPSCCNDVYRSPTFTSNLNPPSLIPCTEHTNSEFPKISVFPSSSVETFSFTKPLSVQSAPVTSSDPCSSTVNESQSPLVANPFATRLPVDQPNAVTSRLHGISSLPVSDNLSPNRRDPLLRIRHVSSRLPGMPTRKPNGGSSETKVPFFIDEEDKLGSVAPFMPRENPRDSVNVFSLSLPSPQNLKGKDEEVKESSSSFQLDENSTRLADDTASQHDEVSASTERYVADVLALLPKLPAADYYIKPSLLELAAREMAEAGFCSHVKDFVVGREGYGSIKFIGETDVRFLDIGSIVQFKDREVTVYPDEGKKPQVGQQLNKEAEVTLLNVKCMDSKTGKQYVEGHQVQSYQETLIKKIEEQGAEFVSYDPVEGEWKVRVQHF